tara:strand:- start:9980 stop:10189 length:210 start_codon:yes stop_codon:yes gene_type:complete
MVRELSDKHLAAINRGRRAAGLPAIRRKKKTKEKKKSKSKMKSKSYTGEKTWKKVGKNYEHKATERVYH